MSKGIRIALLAAVMFTGWNIYMNGFTWQTSIVLLMLAVGMGANLYGSVQKQRAEREAFLKKEEEKQKRRAARQKSRRVKKKESRDASDGNGGGSVEPVGEEKGDEKRVPQKR